VTEQGKFGKEKKGETNELWNYENFRAECLMSRVLNNHESVFYNAIRDILEKTYNEEQHA
jgi:hypothetical protein